MALVAISLAACSVLPSPTPASPGQAAREQLVRAYLDALAAGDEAAVQALVNPRVDAGSEVADALQRYGGVQLHDVQVAWDDQFGGSYVRATVTGTAADGRAYELLVPMSRVEDRYYLAIGEATPNGHEADPGSPRPAP